MLDEGIGLTTVLLPILILVAACLYASVGHGGASGYLAAMAFLGMAPFEMKPAALSLNILVSAIGAYKFARAGRFSWSLLWPLVVTSIPMAYLGGVMTLPSTYYKPVLGLVLIYAAIRFTKDNSFKDQALNKPDRMIVLLIGAVLGFLSGLVGVGGGIFLSPLLIFLRWEEPKNVSGVAALFIFVNSMAGLSGFASSHVLAITNTWPLWALAAIVGGFIGAEYGSKRFGNKTIKRLLATVLLIAGLKMFLTV
ncbi:MAG: putative membrane protein YfcA [Candidatus Krumholzibacteriia bacterium]|jgi:uncharacterized membrane protein YfcA